MFEKKSHATISPLLVLLLLLLYLPVEVRGWEAEPIHYALQVELAPKAHRLTARATITLPPEFPRQFAVGLHQGLEPRAVEPEVRLEPAGRSGPGGGRLEIFTVSLPPGQASFTLAYGGKIHHPLGFSGRDYARGVRYTPGRIDPAGVYLSPAAHWYPRLLHDDHFLRFRLRVKLPPDWAAVSQGRLLAEPQPAASADRDDAARRPASDETVWEENNPQEGIFLVADRFKIFRDQVTLPRASAKAAASSAASSTDDQSGPARDATSGTSEAAASEDGRQQVTTLVYLREDDPELARRYLEATASYLRRYSEMLGPYPYSKFAMVENAWESGFGMPSFTLLGSRVIRLPFILHTSYPHEILHNWWGNGVFTDYARGNWNEGLTAHLADHLLMEERGRGAEYRLGVLQKYADYAAGGRDFPLRHFTARHSPAGEAVGYGKGLMLFHMLEQQLGREPFLAGLREFYQRHLFRVASFADLQRSFEQQSGQDLAAFFEQWLERRGAPELVLEEVSLTPRRGGWRLQATLGQQQPGPPYHLQVPLAVTLNGEEEPRTFRVPLEGRRVDWQADFEQKPQQLALDPGFDLFRLLDRREIPPAFSRLFGAEDDLLVILPGEEEQLLPSYRELAAALGRFGSAGVEVVLDHELTSLPADRQTVVLGWENRFQPQAATALTAFEAELLTIGQDRPGLLRLANQVFSRAGHVFALALPHPDNPATTLGWIAIDQPVMLAGLIRRLPHYHRYGAVVFQGDQAEKILSHHWPAPHSPLRRDFNAPARQP